MSSGLRIKYDDAWIADRWDDTRNWLTLCNEYNAAHGTGIGYNTFKSHCNRELGLNYHYTDEQNEWLFQNYPHLGRKKASQEFKRIFGQYRSPQALKLHCNRNLGLRVTAERKSQIAVENTKRFHPVGTVMVVGNNGLCEKTENGWERIADRVIGKAPNGYRIIHLDGDVLNNSADNLRHVSWVDCAMMTKNKFWSKHPKITETGLQWCELKKLLERSEAECSIMK